MGPKDTFFYPKHTLNCSGQLLTLEAPIVMGILNTTPDSFYSQSRTQTISDGIAKADQMISEGATIIDVGGYSSRPGADHISANAEIERVVPLIEGIKNQHPEALISIDTFRSEVANAAIAAGACILNDISAGSIDPEILDVASEHGTPYIAMHMQGTPQTMQLNPTYENVTKEVLYFFSEKLQQCYEKGIKDVIIDPGFGFGKTIEHNFRLLNQLDLFQTFGTPVLAGISRKSMIYKTLQITAQEALNGTSVLHTIGVQKGAQILRVHDVKEAMEVIRLTQQLKNSIPAEGAS